MYVITPFCAGLPCRTLSWSILPSAHWQTLSSSPSTSAASPCLPPPLARSWMQILAPSIWSSCFSSRSMGHWVEFWASLELWTMRWHQASPLILSRPEADPSDAACAILWFIASCIFYTLQGIPLRELSRWCRGRIPRQLSRWPCSGCPRGTKQDQAHAEPSRGRLEVRVLHYCRTFWSWPSAPPHPLPALTRFSTCATPAGSIWPVCRRLAAWADRCWAERHWVASPFRGESPIPLSVPLRCSPSWLAATRATPPRFTPEKWAGWSSPQISWVRWWRSSARVCSAPLLPPTTACRTCCSAPTLIYYKLWIVNYHK